MKIFWSRSCNSKRWTYCGFVSEHLGSWRRIFKCDLTDRARKESPVVRKPECTLRINAHRDETSRVRSLMFDSPNLLSPRISILCSVGPKQTLGRWFLECTVVERKSPSIFQKGSRVRSIMFYFRKSEKISQLIKTQGGPPNPKKGVEHQRQT